MRFFILLLTLLFFVTSVIFISNHSDTEDAYRYAAEIEQAANYSEVYHTQHGFYHFTQKFLYDLLHLSNAFTLGLFFSLFFSLLTLFFTYKILIEFLPNSKEALVGTFFICFSYGYWRYSWAVEVHSLLWFLQILFIYLLLKIQNWNVQKTALFSLFIAITSLFHVCAAITMIPLLVFYLILKRKLTHIIVTILLFSTIYIPINHKLYNEIQPSDQNIAYSYIPKKDPPKENRKNKVLEIESIPKSFISLGTSIISPTLILSSDKVHHFFSKNLYANRFLEEEYLLAKSTPRWFFVIWLISVFTLGILITKRLTSRKSATREQIPKKQIFYSICFSSIASATFLVWFEPGNPEIWILFTPVFLIPLAIIFTRKKVITVSVVTFFALSNLIGGVAPLTNPKSNYYEKTTSNFRKKGKSGDIIVLGVKNINIARYHHYHLPLECIFFLGSEKNYPELEQRIKKEQKNGKNIFLHRTFIERNKSFKLVNNLAINDWDDGIILEAKPLN